jgi:hypothetical protein
MTKLISAETPPVGVYILENDATNWVGNNNPGLCDLDNLSLGDTYIYLKTLIRIDLMLNTGGSGDFIGHRFSSVAPGKTGHVTGEDDLENVVLVAEVIATTEENARSFVKLNNRQGDGQKYLIQRYGVSDWRQFPNDVGALRKYIPVYTTGCTVVDTGEKDRKQLTISGVATW